MKLCFFKAAIVLLLLTCIGACSSSSRSGFSELEVVDYQLTDADRKIVAEMKANMVAIPAGEFLMGDNSGLGDDEELPVRTVKVPAFAMSRYEVTFEQYDLYVRMTGGLEPEDRWGRGRQPVIHVNWHDAADFALWAAYITGLPFRLPTEAEWEYAARAGSKGPYSFGAQAEQMCEWGNIADLSTDIGWRNASCDDGYRRAAPVGQFKPNRFGLYDMHGNVWEWLADCWHGDYEGAPADARPWGDSCGDYVQRGGAWLSDSNEARSSYRAHGGHMDATNSVGFRLAQDLAR